MLITIPGTGDCVQDCAREKLRCPFEIVGHQKITALTCKTPTEKNTCEKKSGSQNGIIRSEKC